MVIFLAGAHGVGKTYLGRSVATSLKLNFASASSLIREELGSSNWEKNKYTSSVDKNQEALISSVSRIPTSETPLLLDGHFVLKNQSGTLVDIPVSTFNRLGLTAIILMEAPSDIVKDRLASRGVPQTHEAIDEIATAELRSADQVCVQLGIPLIRLTCPTENELQSSLRKFIRP